MYDSVEITADLSFDETGLNNVSTQPLFEDMISLFEVQQAVKATKSNKASGVYSIPVEVLKMTLQYLVCMYCSMSALESVRFPLSGERAL